MAAKKKKGGKNKKQKQNNQQSGFAWASSFTLKPSESSTLRELASLTCASFEGRTGKPLSESLKGAADIPKALWNAPDMACVVVAPGNDCQIVYANVAALETVGLKPDQFEQFLSTQQEDQTWKAPENRVVADFPASMGDKTYESGYNNKIIRGETDIYIQDAHRFAIQKSALVDAKFQTENVGVAYAWASWLEGTDTECRPGGQRDNKVDVEQLKKDISAQGEVIRELKQVQGLGNKDPKVANAVEELLRLKKLLETVS